MKMYWGPPPVLLALLMRWRHCLLINTTASASPILVQLVEMLLKKGCVHVGGVNKRYAHKWQQVIFYLSERGEKKVRPWCASCHLSQGPHVSRNSKSSPHYRHPILNPCKTNCSTDPRSAQKLTSTSPRILPRSPDWQLINLPWLQSLLPGDRAWARAEDSPVLAVSIPAGPPAWIKHSQQEGDKMVKTRKRGCWGFRRTIKQNKSLSARVCLYWVGVQICVTKR